MVISMEQYASLRREFLEVAKFHIKPTALNELKSLYKEAINSVRASDGIENIEDLVRILEKRGVIRYDNVTPLKHIATMYLSNLSINCRLNDYIAWVKCYTPPYSPQANIYQLKNGESYSQNKIVNNLSINLNSNRNIESSSRYKSSHVSPPNVFGDDLSGCNNSAVSIGLLIDPESTEISLINNVSVNSNRNNDYKSIKDCKIRVLSREKINVLEDERKILSDVPIPSDLIFENKRNDEPSPLMHSLPEDSDKFPPNTPLLTIPRSNEPQTTVSFSIIGSPLLPCNFLKQSSSKDNLNVVRTRFNKLIKRRFVKVSSIAFAIILSCLFIAYGLLENSVRYNPEPSAPIFQENRNGHPTTSSDPFTVYGSYLNQYGNTANNETQRITKPLQTLSVREARLQAKVFERVSQRLGRFWPDVARLLDLRECDIENIEHQYRTIEDKAHAALKMFADTTDLDFWQMKLKKALGQARRNDLKDDVEEILSRRF